MQRDKRAVLTVFLIVPDELKLIFLYWQIQKCSGETYAAVLSRITDLTVNMFE